LSKEGEIEKGGRRRKNVAMAEVRENRGKTPYLSTLHP
jgi:hypothetical protein